MQQEVVVASKLMELQSWYNHPAHLSGNSKLTKGTIVTPIAPIYTESPNEYDPQVYAYPGERLKVVSNSKIGDYPLEVQHGHMGDQTFFVKMSEVTICRGVKDIFYPIDGIRKRQ